MKSFWNQFKILTEMGNEVPVGLFETKNHHTSDFQQFFTIFVIEPTLGQQIKSWQSISE